MLVIWCHEDSNPLSKVMILFVTTLLGGANHKARSVRHRSAQPTLASSSSSFLCSSRWRFSSSKRCAFSRSRASKIFCSLACCCSWNHAAPVVDNHMRVVVHITILGTYRSTIPEQSCMLGRALYRTYVETMSDMITMLESGIILTELSALSQVLLS